MNAYKTFIMADRTAQQKLKTNVTIERFYSA